jgi:glyoxalase family protein
VPAESAITAFHGATERVRAAGPTDRFLREQLGFTLAGEEGARRRYRAGTAGVGVYDLIVDPAAPAATGGCGTMHHIAWMTADVAANERWRDRLVAAGTHVSPLMDRNYFHSIYFREPGGVLFEFATNGPGFAIDEPPDRLGAALKLPAQYEEQRARIEATLPTLP